jgi:hypothetical protein
MSVGTRQHCLLEAALYAAFPQEPLPSLEWATHTSFETEAQLLFKGKRWPEAVGLRLTYGELDPSLNTWALTLPAEVMRYFLPCHLMMASLRLKLDDRSDYCSNVMEALLLPSGNPGADAVLDAAMSGCFALDAYPDRGIALYQMLSAPQRACVAAYLDLYAAYHGAFEFDAPVRALYEANRDTWLNSSLIQANSAS